MEEILEVRLKDLIEILGARLEHMKKMPLEAVCKRYILRGIFIVLLSLPSIYTFYVSRPFNADKVIALSGLLVSLLVFYTSVLVPFFDEPILRIEKLERQRSPDTTIGGHDSLFLRLKVINCGKSTAKHCTGRLLQVRNEKGKKIEKFDPLYLYWSRQSTEPSFKPVDIQGDQDAYFLDIAQVHYPQDKWCVTLRVVIPDGHTLINDPQYEKYNNAALPFGIYYIQVALYGENASYEASWFKINAGFKNGTNEPEASIEKYNGEFPN